MAYVPNYDAQSLYRYTPYRGRFLDIYRHIKIDPHVYDTVRIIKEAKYHLRPDNFAYDFYGDPDLFWVVPIRNGFQDLVFDFYQGRKIYVPHPSYVTQLIQ